LSGGNKKLSGDTIVVSADTAIVSEDMTPLFADKLAVSAGIIHEIAISEAEAMADNLGLLDGIPLRLNRLATLAGWRMSTFSY